MCGFYGSHWRAAQRSMRYAEEIAAQRQEAAALAATIVEADVATAMGAKVLGLRKLQGHYVYITKARTRVPKVPA